VVQEGGLFPHVTARASVTLLARHLGWSPARVDAGQRRRGQRVGLMRALMLDPPLLLLDEPMGAVDPMVTVRLQHDLKRIYAELETTVILVTHGIEEAAFLAHEVAPMRDGRIVRRGTMRDLETADDPSAREFVEAQRGAWNVGSGPEA
jgi:osmoprotectant transport system ATP-binding protein